ncbi:hypothetical protein [Brevundimonas nasdae]|uniref:Uncharacterized protein n=1 Tax=Brevundimonas nasdae TaxID=172043 RepID=A0ACD4VKP3_9CAUL|nr:hypothetical protein [Brevundimonas nasdae]WOB78477.1 hypothetical protein PZA08_14415 [Brevundimonas nasdae]
MRHTIEQTLIELAEAIGDRATVRQAILFVMIAVNDPPGNIRTTPRMTLARARLEAPIGQAISRSWLTLKEAGLVERPSWSKETREQPMHLTPKGRALWDRINQIASQDDIASNPRPP